MPSKRPVFKYTVPDQPGTQTKKVSTQDATPPPVDDQKSKSGPGEDPGGAASPPLNEEEAELDPGEEPDPDPGDPPEDEGQEGEDPGEGGDGDDDGDDPTEPDDPDECEDPDQIVYCYCCGCPWWECNRCRCWSPWWYYSYHTVVYWPSYRYSDWYSSYAQYQRKYDTNDYCPSIYTTSAMVTDAGDESLEMLNEGAICFREGRYLEALQYFRLAALADLNAPIPKFAYAHTLFALGVYEYAAYEIRQGMALLPDWPQLGGDLTLMYDDPADFEEQLTALKTYLEMHEDEDASLVLGYVLFFSGDLYAAEEIFMELAASTSMGNASVAGQFLGAIEMIKEIMAQVEEES